MGSRIAVIRKEKGKFCVKSPKNPDWNGGCYDSKSEAEERLHEVEYFKHKSGYDMGARDEFQNIVTARNVARRAAGSATPIFDKLFQDESKVNVSLGAAEKKLGPLVTKVTDMVKKTYGEGPGIPDLLGTMMDATQKVFGHFRDLISGGQREVDEVKDANFEAAKEARNLFTAVKEMSQAYNALAQVRQDKKGEAAPKVAKDLAEAVSKVKSVYAQYVKAYDTRS